MSGVISVGPRHQYLCYLEAYTEARTGGIVKIHQVIDIMLDSPEEDVFADVELARAIAIGASDGAHGCPAPMTQSNFESFCRGEKPGSAIR